jgi:hypothetical protein
MWKKNVCRFLITLNAFDVNTACDAADVQALFPFLPNHLKQDFCNILDGIVHSSSQY